MQIGVTGGIGSGKSLVCKIFNSLGVPIYEADKRAKELTVNNPNVKESILQAFGAESYLNGGVNNSYLAKKVFQDKGELELLNSIIHPAVAEDYKLWQRQHQEHKYVIKEAAILFESGSYKTCDKVILVDAPINIRLDRVTKRDHVTEEEVRRRMNNQWSSDKKAALSDFIINNDGNEALIPQVMKIHQKLLAL